MYSIYKIVNDLNSKVYVGRTKRNIKDCWKDCKKPSANMNRPICKAIQDLGASHFQIEVIEEVNDDVAESRERYWIAYYASHIVGYNETIGGGGKPRFYDEDVITIYKKYKNCEYVAKIYNTTAEVIRDLLSRNNVKVLSGAEVTRRKCGKTVRMYDERNDVVKYFDNYASAAQYLIKTRNLTTSVSSIVSFISKACTGQKNTAYGCTWSN